MVCKQIRVVLDARRAVAKRLAAHAHAMRQATATRAHQSHDRSVLLSSPPAELDHQRSHLHNALQLILNSHSTLQALAGQRPVGERTCEYQQPTQQLHVVTELFHLSTERSSADSPTDISHYDVELDFDRQQDEPVEELQPLEQHPVNDLDEFIQQVFQTQQPIHQPLQLQPLQPSQLSQSLQLDHLSIEDQNQLLQQLDQSFESITFDPQEYGGLNMEWVVSRSSMTERDRLGGTHRSVAGKVRRIDYVPTTASLS